MIAGRHPVQIVARATGQSSKLQLQAEVEMDGDIVATAGQCPVAHGARSLMSLRGRSNRDWWPNQLNLRVLHQNSALSDPMGKGFDYGTEFQRLDLESVRRDLYALMTDFAGLVAGRLRPLWRAVHPDGVAQCRHLPHRRRPRRRLLRHAALRAAQQLAGQCQPRQGAPAALADQAEVRRADLLGRPDDPDRQLRARIDGLQDLRLRWRARRHLGAAGGHLLGRRGDLARRHAL